MLDWRLSLSTSKSRKGCCVAKLNLRTTLLKFFIASQKSCLARYVFGMPGKKISVLGPHREKSQVDKFNSVSKIGLL